MPMCATVLIRHTHFELLPKWIAKTPIFAEKWRPSWIGGHFEFRNCQEMHAMIL
jgi:hypothetical protein